MLAVAWLEVPLGNSRPSRVSVIAFAAEVIGRKLPWLGIDIYELRSQQTKSG